ncbi:MAG: serine acetyltransferase [Eubacteriales bacterium]|nr:serine acetyltransferase [Eubacteriales bacterium]
MNKKYDLDEGIIAVSKQLAERNSKPFHSLNRSGMKTQVEDLLRLLRSAMYPRIFGESCADDRLLRENIQISLRRSALLLYGMLGDMENEETNYTEELVYNFITGLDEICEYLETDVQAAYEGDPAAGSETEIMLAYPAFEAISIYRIAHKLYRLGIKIIPRMMTEYAHQMTGIDIHPGADIDKYFFIDHGTGVVIGETCTIKDHVKLYQGVTLGARSFQLDDRGNPVKGIKRHPDIGSHVIIYAGATILGGGTAVGDNSIIGSNVWLTHSVPAGSKIYYTPNGSDITVC